ncbi:MAG: TetR/AcrR family transcriptional regulator [Candidatus Aminicenantes bacterium]
MPKIIDKVEKKETILEASIKVFAERGWRNTKIADIAEAANIGKGTVYEYFRSKDELFAASFQYFMAEAERIVVGRLEQISDPLERLEAYISAWADILESKNVEYMEIVLDFWAEGIRNKGRSSSLDLLKFYYDNRSFIEQLLKDCIATDSIKSVDTKIVASIIIGALDGLMIQWIMDKNAFAMKEAVSSFVRLVVEGLKKEK